MACQEREDRILPNRGRSLQRVEARMICPRISAISRRLGPKPHSLNQYLYWSWREVLRCREGFPELSWCVEKKRSAVQDSTEDSGSRESFARDPQTMVLLSYHINPSFREIKEENEGLVRRNERDTSQPPSRRKRSSTL